MAKASALVGVPFEEGRWEEAQTVSIGVLFFMMCLALDSPSVFNTGEIFACVESEGVRRFGAVEQAGPAEDHHAPRSPPAPQEDHHLRTSTDTSRTLPHRSSTAPPQVRYRPGEKFTWHLDALPPSPELASKGGQRIATLLVYLTEMPDEDGGATAFRDLGPLRVRPRKVWGGAFCLICGKVFVFSCAAEMQCPENDAPTYNRIKHRASEDPLMAQTEVDGPARSTAIRTGWYRCAAGEMAAFICTGVGLLLSDASPHRRGWQGEREMERQ